MVNENDMNFIMHSLGYESIQHDGHTEYYKMSGIIFKRKSPIVHMRTKGDMIYFSWETDVDINDKCKIDMMVEEMDK